MYDQEFEKARTESDGDLEYAAHHPFQVSVGAHSTKVRETSTNRAASGAEVTLAIQKSDRVRALARELSKAGIALQESLGKVWFRQAVILPPGLRLGFNTSGHRPKHPPRFRAPGQCPLCAEIFSGILE
ncbi:MAG: hypothetical protein HWD58_04970 [Bacteroidota bacterium]|nr:MAG: hypothetical protein HWD58_04970 [Bacteroidota bacterium]